VRFRRWAGCCSRRTSVWTCSRWPADASRPVGTRHSDGLSDHRATEVIVVGSQAIIGSFREDELPADATRSVEVDILPIANSNDETARLADLTSRASRASSPHSRNCTGFSIDGVDLETSALPDRWRDRLVRVQNANTAAPAGQPQVHRLAGQGRSLCRQALRVQGEGSQPRCSPVGARTPRCGRDPGAASQRRGSTPARCRPCCGVLESWKGVV
jgi:hypothetical protein